MRSTLSIIDKKLSFAFYALPRGLELMKLPERDSFANGSSVCLGKTPTDPSGTKQPHLGDVQHLCRASQASSGAGSALPDPQGEGEAAPGVTNSPPASQRRGGHRRRAGHLSLLPPHNQLRVSGPTCAASRGRSRGRGIPGPGSSRLRASPGQPRPGRSRSPAAATRGRARASAPGMRGELGPAPAPEKALRELPEHGEAAPALLLSDSRLRAWAAQLFQVPGKLGGKAQHWKWLFQSQHNLAAENTPSAPPFHSINAVVAGHYIL